VKLPNLEFPETHLNCSEVVSCIQRARCADGRFYRHYAGRLRRRRIRIRRKSEYRPNNKKVPGIIDEHIISYVTSATVIISHKVKCKNDSYEQNLRYSDLMSMFVHTILTVCED
jgi:hypothetical protein